MTAEDLAQALPGIAELRERCRTVALLDVLLDPDQDFRYFTFGPWGTGEQIASMRNGAGDEWDIVFGPAGAFLRGFDHESPMAPAANDEELWPGLLHGLPEEFAVLAAEKAFSYEETLEATVCLWRPAGDDEWHTGYLRFPPGSDPDGSGWLFRVLLDPTPEAYATFAEGYYGRPVDREALAEVFAGKALTDDLAGRLSPGRKLADLTVELVDLGVPVEF